VIQMCCHGVISTRHQQDETEIFHFSLPVFMETQSEDWDSPVQVVLERGHTITDTPGQVSQVEERNLSRLTDVQVDLEDQVYSHQLDFALHSEWQGEGGTRQDEGFWTLPIEEVLPTPAHIPESFKGKSWAQIEREDEERVEKLVRQFRQERFICYFDSESLARYGRRSQNKRRRGDNGEAEPDNGALPLLDHDEDESAYMRRRRKKRRAFRVASRCQVVKVSHSTQTVRLVVPAVRQPASEVPPTSFPAANQTAAERTPETQTWRCLPPSYSNIITPLQPRTSLVYLLCSPSGPAPADTPAPCSAPKRCRRKRRPLDLSGLKVKYKRLPVRFYDPSSNRILKNAPKGCLWRRGSAPSSPPLPCVRQLFRSLSPDLNADRPPGEGAAGSSRVKGSRSSDATFSHANSFLLSTLSRDSAQTDKQDTGRRRGRMSQAPPPPPLSRSGRGGRSRPPLAKRRTRAQATPPQPRREGLRQAGPGRKVPSSAIPLHPPSPRRGRARRGRGCERSRR
ncbi:DBF4-type zinc finger-containing protein 2, partial [Pempheris klunzingeri]|uniref:DBF4-type zinc finger-containing protein 2 n=1 Tax=Pempheris klunzingeri TaxID=3127111 RepID=UPI00398057ED